MSEHVAAETRALLRSLLERAQPDEAAVLQALDQLFDEPARIAIAGMVKAGKSTLLNALVGERVAPTDAGECTRIPTWYRKGQHYEVRAVDRQGGEGGTLRFVRGEELVVDLGERDPAAVNHLVVACPSTRLGHQTLIDLPGHSSLSVDVSERAKSFLVADDGTPVDGVLYLLRHRHPADLEFLDAFHGAGGGRGAMGAIGVLSRADEVFGGGLGAMDDATRAADALRHDPRIRGLCQDVIPVAGLLAESAAGLRDDEVIALRHVAVGPGGDTDTALRSVDAFRTGGPGGPDAEERQRLLERLGLFGIRVAVEIFRRDPDRSADALASDLLAVSGIGQLRSRLDSVVNQRLVDLRARTVLDRIAISSTLRGDPTAVAEWERIEANAHGLRELAAAATIRRASVPGLSGEAVTDLERLLGVFGVSVSERLGAAATTDPAALRARTFEQHQRWTSLREGPLTAPITQQLAAVGVRTCEALLTTELAAS